MTPYCAITNGLSIYGISTIGFLVLVVSFVSNTERVGEVIFLIFKDFDIQCYFILEFFLK